MKLLTIVFLLLINAQFTIAQFPLKYKLKRVEGIIYDESSNPVTVSFKSRKKLNLFNCKNENLDTFLRTLPLAKYGRKELEYLISTSAKVTVIVSNKVGILLKDGKYRIIGGISGPSDNQDHSLTLNEAGNTLWVRLFNKHKYMSVYAENTIEIFKGSVTYGNNRSTELRREDVKLFDWASNKEVKEFSLDTIKIEPLCNPKMMYKNIRELYYFAGLHEIYHIRPENIHLQEANRDSEIDAITLETKAFKQRSAVNKRKIIIPKPPISYASN